MNTKTEDILLTIPSHDTGGFDFIWEDNSIIKTSINKDVFIVTANKEGLISLGRHLIALAQQNIKDTDYLSFDEFNDLEKGSKRIAFVKDDNLT